MTVHEAARLVVFCLGYIIVFFSLVPLIRSNYWFIRIWDYPRSQKFWLNTGVILIFLFVAQFDRRHDQLFGAILVVNQIYLLSLIWSYMPLTRVQMKRNPGGHTDSVKILIANVFQDNQNTDRCSDSIRQMNPDVILLVETDQRWSDEVQKCFNGEYPYRVLHPQENTYGMLVISKLKIVNQEVRFLAERDVPSITADIETREGKTFRLYCVHPRPPIPHESKDSTERDAEILLIGNEAKKHRGPVIVAGDLNDVAWSYTTHLFLKVSELLDPRIGRGFFSTYHANYRFFRWPLDHVFCSAHFYLNDLKRLPSIDSDHFPIFIDVALMPHEIKENIQMKKQADRGDEKVAREKMQEAQNQGASG